MFLSLCPIVFLKAGYCHESKGHTAQVTEYVFVAEGTLTLNVNQTVYTLIQGEANFEELKTYL